MPKRRSGERWDDLKRRRPTRQPNQRFLIVCEGAVTERGYFEALRRHTRSFGVEVVIHDEHGMAPKTSVECAARLKKKAERDAKQKEDENRRYDAVWCVFDIDTHPYVAEARQQAQANGIELAISNPCFELWALLHLQEQSAPLNNTEARRLLKKHLPEYDKALPFEELEAQYAKAHNRAVDLDKRQESAGQPGGNPSTGVYKLVQRIRTGAGANSAETQKQ